MTRNAFVFSIGYSGGTAIVDRKLEAKYGRLTTRELFAEGLYKAAFASALYDNNTEDLEWLRVEYSRLSGTPYRNTEELKRAFGVSEVYPAIQRTSYL